MDNQSLNQEQQPQTTQQHQQQATTKNIRNLSIKEFFTTRLMRARSFEGGGGANSPKDEASNWFDEFKARMTKKSQAHSSKHSAAGSSINSTATGDDNNDESVDSSESVARFSSNQSRSRHHHGNKDDIITSLVKDNCDTYLSKLTESIEDFDNDGETHETNQPESSQTPLPKSSSKRHKSKIRYEALRARRPPRISCVESPNFDTASINTIFNRRDSRYDTISPKTHRFSVANLFSPIVQAISYLLPFNYNLPWKLVGLLNLTFVIIVIGMMNQTNPGIMTFTFFNGFICGIFVAIFGLIILLISLVVQILPRSRESKSEYEPATIETPTDNERVNTPNISLIASRGIQKLDVEPSAIESKVDDFSFFEVLDNGNRLLFTDQDGEARSETMVEDEDYKGWMIEFIGDYELRNKGDIKLKLIFVRIENRILYLCKPKNSHDAETATCPVFVHQRIYDLNAAKKFSAYLLLPKNVRNKQKYVWSKKYPIKLEFQDDNEQANKTPDAPKLVQLTLFAKSCREKEEWFRKFKRIFEENKVASGISNKRLSLQSDLSGGNNDDGLLSAFKNFRCRSPSPSTSTGRDGVQTSHSSHLLNDLRKVLDDENEPSEPSSNLIRTKSCEQLHNQGSSNTSSYLSQPDDVQEGLEMSGHDDSTLTRETAEVYSQAVEYSNFIDSLPNLSYREYIERVILSGQAATSTSDWFNALTGRIFFDVLSHDYWSVWFKRKIQRKLYRIRLPYFMETLTLTKIDLGTNAPQFLNVASHSFDSFGLSIDFDMAYSGGLTMTFETKLNLLKIKSDNSSSNATAATPQMQPTNSTPASGDQNTKPIPTCEPPSRDTDSINDPSLDNFNKIGNKPSLSSSGGSARTSGESSDSDESESDSSSDSSFDGADINEISDWEDYGAEKTRQSIVRFVDKIASSRYFQHATENRYIKKKLQDISNCPLVLIVKIQSLTGVLTLNVPPPQTDRVWYGFKPNPELTLKALPKMGDREVNLSHVTDWIERKLAEEFRKILVIPNMEDIVLPVLKSDHLIYVTTTK